MDRALAEGINFFDTANVYGFDAGKGRTEEVLGTWFAQGGERREKTVLATKVYGSMTDWPNDTFLSARNIVRACEALLRRMQTDWIDLYQFHHVDLRTPWEEIWQACETLVAQGKVLYVGSSNHAAWQIAAANEAAAPPQLPGPGQRAVALQPAHPRTSSSRCCRPPSTTASAIIPWSPLAGGLLARACWRRPRADGATRSATAEAGREAPPALEEYEAFCREIGHAPADVGLAWLLHQPAVTAPIVGPRTMEQFEGALTALEVRLDDDAARPARRDLPRLQGRPHGVRLVGTRQPTRRRRADASSDRPCQVGLGPRWLSISRTSVTGQAGPR